MTKKDANHFELIYDKSKIDEIIDFLSANHKATLQHYNRLSLQLKLSPENIPVAAINRSFGKISIALLLIYQGKETNSKKDILNLTTWYAVPEKRGIGVFSFVKKLTGSLSNYILTDYTPNPAAKRIFKSVGFANMKISIVKGGLSKKFPFFLAEAFKWLAASNKTLKTKKMSHQSIRLLNIDIENSIISENKKNSTFFSIHPKRFIGIPVNILNIYHMSNQKLCINFIKIIILMFKHKATMLLIYFIDLESKCHEAEWIVLSDDKKIEYISPMYSELEALHLLNN